MHYLSAPIPPSSVLINATCLFQQNWLDMQPRSGPVPDKGTENADVEDKIKAQLLQSHGESWQLRRIPWIRSTEWLINQLFIEWSYLRRVAAAKCKKLACVIDETSCEFIGMIISWVINLRISKGRCLRHLKTIIQMPVSEGHDARRILIWVDVETSNRHNFARYF